VTAETLPQRDVTPILERAGELTYPALRQAVDTLAPQMRRVAGYHLGWLDAAGNEQRSGRGKGIRYTLALLGTEAVGAPVETGIPGGVAVELIHNFSLLHDDLMDGDEERHHRATAWTIFGSSAAILGGVALLALAEEVLLAPGTSQGAAAAKMLTEATARLVTGQTDDLDFETRTAVPLEECVRMAGNKTAALISASAAIGAVLAGAPEPTVTALAAFGEHLGLAFQLVDDLLGIWGAPELTGKPVLADLRAGKKTLPVSAALHAGGPPAEELATLLADGGDDPARFALEAELIERAGGRDWTVAEARRQLALAQEQLAGAGLARTERGQEAARELSAVADFVVRRQL
jgi:geranylgeranyl diphosphate synthase type I